MKKVYVINHEYPSYYLQDCDENNSDKEVECTAKLILPRDLVNRLRKAQNDLMSVTSELLEVMVEKGTDLEW